MTRALPLLVGLLLVTAGLAGCLSSGDGSAGADAAEQGSLSADNADTSPAPGDQAGASSERSAIAFAQEEPVQETIWANGTFAANENCYASGCLTGQAVRLVELGDPLPGEAPARISAELTYDTGPTIFLDTIDLFVWSEDGTFYTFDRTEEEGRETVTSTLVKASEPLVLEVFYQWPTGAEPEVEYTLRVDVEVAPTTLPPGVPVAVDAEPGQRLVAERADDGGSGDAAGPGLLAYGPDDNFLDRYAADGDSLEVTLPEATSGGEHVFVVPENRAPVRVLANGSAHEMRPLALTVEQTEPVPVDGAQPVAWSFEIDERPLAAGVAYEVGRPIAVTADVGQATLTGPQGDLVSGELGCGTCILTGSFHTIATPIGGEGLAAGSYDAVYEPTAEAGTQVSGLVVTYER